MARKNPADAPMMAEQSPHEKKLSEMHSALHSLGDQARKPSPMMGEKLLPPSLQKPEGPGVAIAKKHIDKLHAAFRGVKGGK
jgi:hypothetical protein